ncbi:MAG: hypothetical protein ACE5SW_11015 [Nitrososphaeraceae archaeon]
MNTFRSFYFARERKELKDEQIQFLQLRPRVIKVHQVKFLTRSNNVISERNSDDIL